MSTQTLDLISDADLQSAAGGGPGTHIAERIAGEYPSKNPAIAAQQEKQRNRSDWKSSIGTIVGWLAAIA